MKQVIGCSCMINMKERERDGYGPTKQRECSGKDMLHRVRVIKNADGHVLTSEYKVLNGWKGSFEKLIDEENKRETRDEEM